ncbi:hypothetical protein FHT72_003493 [Rhizobium sp. BK077]|uniref:hypothetical protein n=1 Tax=Rhizobium TaxID=379 RepID=UPI0007B528D8|nr:MULTISPECIES: hypothetical protein [Rhizobium]KZS51343.1 hypothetical protein AS890_04930 [Rhizobium anhuiense bv. trifolii]MBB3299728.1 hypothetical protein [Rhizobium sp. BK112]MBB3369004.1 hypothetical protein [Rhizobium sp. BK077]MBB4179618.1 hypothetical protein [Rhizobium sp. BK109]
MNIKRGLFRLWLVLSVMFVTTVFVFTYSSMKSEFDKSSLLAAIPANDEVMIPVSCYQTRGSLKVDFELATGITEKEPWERCWYELKKFRVLFPEYKDLDDEQLVTKTYIEAKVPLYPARPWQALGWIALIAFGIPLGVLIAGGSLVWALFGFAGQSKAS